MLNERITAMKPPAAGMLNERVTAMRPVATAMHKLEDDINRTMISLSEAMASIAAARMHKKAHLPLEAGMAASQRLAVAYVGLADTYEEVVTGHRHLGTDRDQLLSRDAVRSWGDIFDTPPVPPPPPSGQLEADQDPVRHLKVA